MTTTIEPLLRLGRALATSGALLLALTTAACNTTRSEPSVTGSVPTDGFRTRHPIVVEEGEETFDVPVGVQGDSLPPRLVAAVQAFGEEARAQGARSITVMVPSASRNEAAAYHAARRITEALGRAGFAASAVHKVPYAAEGPEDAAPIRISYPRVVAHVPHRCGRWPDQVVGDLSNADYWNFGCATQANVATMAAEPTDLVAPSPIGKADATRRAAVIQAYRKGEKTRSEFKLPDTNASKVGGGGGE
ncbi:CpaD family pilus assembly protein [Pinisolibacter sp.]|uniref:CpaD family pilus assembly protein n=1 Tax=Pinisolibacter sp. TaxID=2172024 RepID=UPI002FDCB972